MIKAKNDQIKKRKHEIYREIKMLIFWGLAENAIARNILKKIIASLELSGKAFMILSSLKKVKRTILLIPYEWMEKPLPTPKIWEKTYLYWDKASKQHPSYQKALNWLFKTFKPETSTTPDKVKNIIKSLRSSKCVGPNSIPIKIIHSIKDKICIILSELINKSFSTGCFPNICKTAKVIHIFKTESGLFCNNYRHISLLLNICKIIEKIMHQRLD